MSPRSKTQLIVVSLLILFGFCMPLMAEPELHFDGQVRVRDENDDKDSFLPNRLKQSWTDLRARLGVSARIEDNTTFYVQFQDSRRLGAVNQFDRFQSGTLHDSKNVDMHQAYLQIDHLWKNGPGFKTGRFEINYGNQRVFGSYDWDNVGRSWEGLMYWLDRPSYRVDLFGLQAEEVPINRDFIVFGLYTDLRKMNAQFFAFWEHDNDVFINSFRLPKNLLDRYNVGTYYQNNCRNFDFTFNGVYQFGERYAFTAWPIHVFQDISAYMLTFETGYTFNDKSDFRVAAGIDYSSGDDNINTGDYTVYQNSYYSGHKFRGYMDYFVNSYEYGLLDSYLHGGFTPFKGWSVKGDLHYFRTDEEYTDSLGTSRNIGVEFDLTITTTRIAGVTFDSGGSIFMPTDEYARRTNPDPGYWLFITFTAEFKK